MSVRIHAENGTGSSKTASVGVPEEPLTINDFEAKLDLAIVETPNASDNHNARNGVFYRQSSLRPGDAMSPLNPDSKGINVEFENITLKFGENEVLKNIHGSMPAGQLHAIMGPTGAGKTTLLRLLANRLGDTQETHTGTVTYDGQQWRQLLKHQTAFVEQDDVVIGDLTVNQFLEYIARLRMPEDMSLAEKIKRRDTWIKILNLKKCANNPIKVISGGERKRTCICAEVLTDPMLLFLDEPTSGLDSSTALVVVKSLRELARKGITIITSIHQPNSQIFEFFDQLMILYGGGLVYQGDANQAKQYFTDLGFPCPPLWSTPDHIMELAVSGRLDELNKKGVFSRDFTKHKQLERLTSSKQLLNGASSSSAAAASPPIGPAGAAPTGLVTVDLGVTVDLDLGAAAVYQRSTSDEEVGAGVMWQSRRKLEGNKTISDRRFAVTWATQTLILIERAYKTSRPHLYSNLLMVQFTSLALLNGVIWFQLGSSEVDIQSRFTFCFWMAASWVFFPMFEAIYVFAGDSTILRKEIAQDSYHLSAYYISKTSVLSLLGMAWPLWNFTIAYWLVRPNPSPLAYLAWLCALYYNLWLMQAIAVCMSAALAFNQLIPFSVILVTLFFSFQGFLVPLDDIPVWISWVAYINPVKYYFEIVLNIVFKDMPGAKVMRYECSEPSAFTSCGPDGPGYISQADILKYYRIPSDPNSIVTAVLVMLAWLVGTKLLCYLLLRHKLRDVL